MQWLNLHNFKSVTEKNLCQTFRKLILGKFSFAGLARRQMRLKMMKPVNFPFKAGLLIKLVTEDYLTLLPLGLINLITVKVYLKQTGPQ